MLCALLLSKSRSAKPRLATESLRQRPRLWMTWLQCRKCSPRATASATSRPLLYQPYSSVPASRSLHSALRRSPPWRRGQKIAQRPGRRRHPTTCDGDGGVVQSAGLCSKQNQCPHS